MAQAMLMAHEADPRAEIMDQVNQHLEDIEVMGASVLMAVYTRPDRTKSGIFLTDKTKDEDRYQGKVGLVLKVGPIAFQDDDTHRFGDFVPTVGDWVLINIGETFPFEMGERRCRIVEDVNVKAILRRPDIAL